LTETQFRINFVLIDVKPNQKNKKVERGDCIMESEHVNTVNDSDFESMVEKSELPCLVDFWAPWCGPCKAIGPVIDELAKEFAGKVQIVKMNVDESPATPGKFGIKAIPTLILFKNGEAIDRITGAVGKAQLKELISKAS
jgi:thioredoxin 1